MMRSHVTQVAAPGKVELVEVDVPEVHPETVINEAKARKAEASGPTRRC